MSSESDGQCSDGGPAFPVEESFEKGVGKYIPGTSGMSLLDYFAGQALANTAIARSDMVAGDTALVCYWQAAAMLKERERLNAKRD